MSAWTSVMYGIRFSDMSSRTTTITFGSPTSTLSISANGRALAVARPAATTVIAASAAMTALIVPREDGLNERASGTRRSCLQVLAHAEVHGVGQGEYMERSDRCGRRRRLPSAPGHGSAQVGRAGGSRPRAQ